MKNLRFTNSLAARSMRVTALASAAAAVAVAAGTLAGAGNAAPARTAGKAAHAQKKQLVVALNQDPDILDPTLSRTYVGRIIYAHMCEKLYDIDEQLRLSPSWPPSCPPSVTAARPSPSSSAAA